LIRHRSHQTELPQPNRGTVARTPDQQGIHQLSYKGDADLEAKLDE
jgi:hypothetical protein